MLSPANQKCIQVELTNFCPHKCSNCTRFCGHYEKPFFVKRDHFQDAIASLEKYPNMVGIMGGEPTMHQDFDWLVRYYRSKIYEPFPNLNVGRPLDHFGKHRALRLSDIMLHKRGLWTSLGKSYWKHYELIQDTFSYQCINTHESDENLHQALLIPRKELDIPDDVWTKLRDECWIQNLWSASITPKGAFFCQVAAALDMLFDGPGGWDLEEDWWKREPKDFGKQLEWCEMCSASLAVPRVAAKYKVDIMSLGIYNKLKDVKSPKLLEEREACTSGIQIFDTKHYNPQDHQVIESAENYLPKENGERARVALPVPVSLTPGRLEAVIVCNNYADYLGVMLPHVLSQVDHAVVVTGPQDEATRALCEALAASSGVDVTCCITDRLFEDGAVFAKAKAINDGLNCLKYKEWVLILDADIILQDNFRENLKKHVLNPGCLYFTRRWGPEFSNIRPFIKQLNNGVSWGELFEKSGRKTKARIFDREGNDIECYPYGYFQLFNYKAEALRDCVESGKFYDEQYTTAEFADMFFGRDMFPKYKIKQLPIPMFDVIHLPHGPYMENWEGRKSPRIDTDVPPKMAIVVSHYNLPIEQLYNFLSWNSCLREMNIDLYLVTEKQKLDNSDHIRQIIVSNLQRYSPALVSNFGIRAAMRGGAEIIMKTDIDCVLPEKLLGASLECKEGFGIFPKYDMCYTYEEYLEHGVGKEDEHNIGTATMWGTDWEKCCAYDERMYGYGREDGDLYDRAQQAGIIMDRALQVIHINHECRVDDKWYPPRTKENSTLSLQDPWCNRKWGLV